MGTTYMCFQVDVFNVNNFFVKLEQESKT